jgi:hypothetical protein
MLDKIKEAALKYDKNHPAAVSLEGFDSKYLTPGAFRITLYRTFHVDLTDKELGSLVHMFDMNNSATATTRSMSPAPSATVTRTSSSSSPSAAAAGAEGVTGDGGGAGDGGGGGAGAGKRFRRGISSSSSMSFDGNSDVTELISTHDFLVHFIRVGYEERSKIRTHHLLHERSQATQQHDESEKKILRQWKIENENFDPLRYRREDYETAMRKITREAERYHSEHVSAPDLSLFNGSDMNPAEFREMIRRQLNLQLSYEEIAALLPLIGSKTKEKMISTAEFLIKFKAIGWERSPLLCLLSSASSHLLSLLCLLSSASSHLLSLSSHLLSHLLCLISPASSHLTSPLPPLLSPLPPLSLPLSSPLLCLLSHLVSSSASSLLSSVSSPLSSLASLSLSSPLVVNRNVQNN